MAKSQGGRRPAVIRPGQIVPNSGMYRDPKSGERTTLVKGKTAPPILKLTASGVRL